MGMYTEFVMAAQIKNDPTVVQILNYMVNDGPMPEELPNHDFFKIKSWKLTLSIDSYYFPGQTNSTFIKDDLHGAAKEPLYFLTVRCNLKNYCNDIDKFLDWLCPYIVDPKDGFLGYSRSEEYDDPSLIYIHDNKIVYHSVRDRQYFYV